MSDQPTTTVVPPWRQAEFKDWLTRNHVTDYLHPQSFYDYGGAFLAGIKGPEPVTRHWPDTFKLPGHPTFSDESKYADPGSNPGHWVNGRLVRAPEGPSMNGKNGKPPKTLSEWVDYLHAARAIPQDSPDYSDAQEAVRFALQRIQTLNSVANATDQAKAVEGKRIGVLGGGAAGILASVRAGEPIAGLIAALTGGSFGEGAGQYRQGLENIGTQQPIATPVGEMLGMGAMAGVPVGQGVTGGTKLAQAATQGVRGPNMVARALLGALHTNVAPGAALGAIQGFSAGGADPGDLQARLQGGAIGAGVGAAGQAAFGGLGALRVPRWLTSVRKEIRAGVPKGTDPALVNEVEEAAVRAGLVHDHYDAEAQDRILAAWRAGKTIAPAPLPPPTQRPGETITPTPRPGDQSLDVPTAIRRGTVVQSPIDQRYAPAEGVLPYYSRGGSMEQAAPPPPVQSPVGRLGTQTLNRSDPNAVASWLKDQIALAESFGQHVTPAKLSKLLAGFDPKIVKRVTKLVRSP